MRNFGLKTRDEQPSRVRLWLGSPQGALVYFGIGYAILALVLCLLGGPARGAELGDDPPKPEFCHALDRMPRSCVTARQYVKMYGRVEAERRARLCGATDADIAQAAQCFGEDR